MEPTKVGPIIDDHVEIPLGSGVRFRADGMLSRHPQCDAIRAAAKGHTGRDWPDVPVVMDHFCPRHQAYVLEQMIVTNRPGETIERVMIVDEQTAAGILDGLMEKAIDALRR